jgi:ribosomal protein L21E
MPFGLSNAPATFQRLMDIVLAGIKWQSCLVYIDDIVVFSPTFEQHVRDLSAVFERLESAGLTLKASKCDFCRKELKYLGHIITSNGIKPDPGLVDSVKCFPQPKKLKDIQSFLGLTGYYRRFIKDYAKISEPFLRLIRSHKKLKRSTVDIEWSDECTEAFEMLKNALTQAPILRAPNFNESFILELDACDYGLGAVLTQEYDNKKFVIAYASRTQSAAERNYFPTEKEALAIFWATKHFRPYLEGTKIYIRSDCRALQWLLDTKDLSGRLARWAISLSAFNIVDIKYKPGKTNTNSDTLSRYPLPNLASLTTSNQQPISSFNLWDNCILLNNIREEQHKDPHLQPIIDELSNLNLPLHQNSNAPFLLINDILYKCRFPMKHTGERFIGLPYLLVIPTSLQQELLSWAHDHPTAGHGGREKTFYRLLNRVYWQNIRRDINNYVQSCHSCQKYKYSNQSSSSPLQMHIVHEPWHTIGIDIMGPFPATQRQKQYLLVVVDYFTRWVELFSLRTTTSNDIANILIDEIICRWGCPTYILSDNGPQFISELFTNICSSLGIRNKNTSNYHPQTNMTERMNRNLKPMIAQYAQENPHSWDKHLPKLALSIRTSVNETTGDTPAFLNFGRDPKLPLDLLLTTPTQNTPLIPTPLSHEIEEYKKNLHHQLHIAHRIANEHNEVRKSQQKRRYDQHTSKRSFKEGQLVWVTIPSVLKHGKLDPQYQGPCRIMEVLSSSSFIIHRLSDGVNLGVTNIDRLKPFYEPNINHPHNYQNNLNTPLTTCPQPLMNITTSAPQYLQTHNHPPPLMNIDTNAPQYLQTHDRLSPSPSHSPCPQPSSRPIRMRKQRSRLNL